MIFFNVSERCIAEQKNKNFEENLKGNCMKNGHYSGMTTRKVAESAAEQRALQTISD